MNRRLSIYEVIICNVTYINNKFQPSVVLRTKYYGIPFAQPY